VIKGGCRGNGSLGRQSGTTLNRGGGGGEAHFREFSKGNVTDDEIKPIKRLFKDIYEGEISITIAKRREGNSAKDTKKKKKKRFCP